jgi:hypothetical protein
MPQPTRTAHDVDIDPVTTTKLCYDGKHARCPGSVYVWPDDAPVAYLAPCTCGCGCNAQVPITRPNAARTRKRAGK